MADLVSLSPPDVLGFNLSADGESRVTLSVTNVSDKPVIFKVKTTQPNWYFVRPNQQIVDVGKTESVVIALTESEKSQLLNLAASDNPVNVDKHRFLIQANCLTSDLFSTLSDVPPAQRAEAFSKAWNSLKVDGISLKLKVQFTYPDPAASRVDKSSSSAATAAAASRDSPSVSENVDIIRNRLARESAKEHDKARDPEAIFTELLTLRNKYDAVVEYTVHLTAERDSIVAQFEDLQRDYAKEVSKKKAGDSSVSTGPSTGGKTDLPTEKKVVQQGFSLLALIVAVFVSLIIGRYVKS